MVKVAEVHREDALERTAAQPGSGGLQRVP